MSEGSCVFSSHRLGDVVAVPRPIAARAVEAVAIAATRLAGDRWEGELATWLAEQACMLGDAAAGLEVDDVAWTPLHFTEQQRFLLDSIAMAAAQQAGDVRTALEGLAVLVRGHEREWVRAQRRWAWAS